MKTSCKRYHIYAPKAISQEENSSDFLKTDLLSELWASSGNTFLSLIPVHAYQNSFDWLNCIWGKWKSTFTGRSGTESTGIGI